MTQHTTPLYVPHLRFAEFSSNWEEKKLGEMLINKRIKWEENLPLYSVTINNGLVRRDSLDRNIADAVEYTTNIVVKKDRIAYNMMRLRQWAIWVAPEDCMVSNAYVVLEPTQDTSTSFYSYYFNSKHPN